MDPRRADLFVVPFLGGFIERDSPNAANTLNRQACAPRARSPLQLLATFLHPTLHPSDHSTDHSSELPSHVPLAYR